VTAGEALRKYTSIFQQAGIDQSVDEAGVLLCHVLKLSKAEIFAQPERTLTGSELTLLEGLIARRLRHEPSAYITGHREFLGLDLSVDSRVLIPRPETEILVEAAIQFGRTWVARSHRRMLAADIGTGSGAMAIALAAHIPDLLVYAVDISPGALEVAASNVRRHGLGEGITLVEGNLLEQIDQRMDLIVANLPYISAADMLQLQPEIVCYEPDVALQGGVDGTEVIRKLLGQVPSKINRNGALFMEIGEGQEDDIMPVIGRCLPGCVITLIKDLAGINRVIKIEVK
jgi:release factor glutamine methyltransferase